MTSISTFATDPAQMRFGRFRRRLTVLGLAVLTCGAIIGIGAGPAFARDLGGINVDAACKDQYGPEYREYLVAIHWTGWKCVTGEDFLPNVEKGVDMNRACRTQYNDSRAYAKISNPTRHDSWYCVVDD